MTFVSMELQALSTLDDISEDVLWKLTRGKYTTSNDAHREMCKTK